MLKTAFQTLVLGTLAAAFVLSLTPAQRAVTGDALALLVRNTPQLTWAVPLLPPAPPAVCTTAPTPGDPHETGALYVPGGSGRHPGVLVLSGVSPAGWQDPRVETLAGSLAGLGLTVYTPNLPGLRTGRVTGQALGALGRDVAWLDRSPHAAGVSLFGVCAGASLAILEAERPGTPVHAVIALDPYADLRDLVETATTGEVALGAGQYESFHPTAWTVGALVRAAAYTVPEPARTALLNAVAASPDPLAFFRTHTPPANLGPAATAWWHLWANRSPAAFPRLWQDLPENVRSELAALSPARGIAALHAPVLMLTPSVDTAYPQEERYKLYLGNPRLVALTVSPLVNHVTPDILGSASSDLGNLWRFAYATAAAVTQSAHAGRPPWF